MKVKAIIHEQTNFMNVPRSTRAYAFTSALLWIASKPAFPSTKITADIDFLDHCYAEHCLLHIAFLIDELSLILPLARCVPE